MGTDPTNPLADGHLDLVVTVGTAVAIMYNNGSGQFNAVEQINLQTPDYPVKDAKGLVVWDFDQNGTKDIAVGATYPKYWPEVVPITPVLILLWQEADGSWADPVVYVVEDDQFPIDGVGTEVVGGYLRVPSVAGRMDLVMGITTDGWFNQSPVCPVQRGR